MPTSSAKFRLSVVVLLLLTLGATVALARWAMLPWALGAALRAGGATEVTFDVKRATPWRLQVDDVAFNLDTARFAAERASLLRAHWWSPSLGRLQVETARLDLDVNQLAGDGGAASPVEPAATSVGLPLDGISIDGRVTLRTGDEPGQEFAVVFEATPGADGDWSGQVKVSAPGLELDVEATYGPGRQELDFQTTRLQLDLQPSLVWGERWLPAPVAPWEPSGKLSGQVRGGYRQGKFAADGELRLRDARLANPELGLVAEGVEADVAAVDLANLQARDLALRARSATIGKVALTDLAARLTSASADQIVVADLTARALGGELRVEPFVHRPAEPGIEAVVQAEGIRAEQVLALTQDLPARATGPLSGRLPLRYDPKGGLRLGTGWLGLTAGNSLEVQLQAEGLLTAGTPPKSANYPVLKQVEDGLLKLKVTELRLEVRPPGAPANRTAQLRIVGAPLDPLIKAPVSLDLNVNGPIESLLNLGLKTGGGAGTKP